MKNLAGIAAIFIFLAFVSDCSFGRKTEMTQTENKTAENKAGENKTDENSSRENRSNMKSSATDLAGEYKLNGTRLDGKTYKGYLSVTKREQVYQFSWQIGQGKYEGIGVQNGNAVAVAYTTGSDGNGCGTVIYKINADESIEGKWGSWGVNQSGTEKAVPKGKTTETMGTFDVEGTNPTGSIYKGKLDISRTNDEVYQFSWDVGEKYIGTGIKVGEYLAAGSGSKQCGFVIYKVKDGKLDGKWGIPGSEKLGTETAFK